MNNILFTVTDESIIDKLIIKGITKLVYPLNSFCVGVLKTFNIEDIKTDGYLLINRVLDTSSVEKLDIILNNLPNNIKGIIFDDLSLIEILKDKPIEKIFFYSHFNTNYNSINEFFNYVDEIIISTDISEIEIDEIIQKSNKKISLFVFGLISSFYSRRELLSNFDEEMHLEYNNVLRLTNMDKKFIAIENEYGTVLYHYPYFNGSRLLNKDIKYKFYFPILLNSDEILKVADNDFSFLDTDEGFLDTKTIYKVKE